MIPCDTDDITKEYDILLTELGNYNSELLHKDRILAITKCDMLDDEMTEQMKKTLPKGVKTVFISSVSGKNIPQLKDMLWATLNNDYNNNG